MCARLRPALQTAAGKRFMRVARRDLNLVLRRKRKHPTSRDVVDREVRAPSRASTARHTGTERDVRFFQSKILSQYCPAQSSAIYYITPIHGMRSPATVVPSVCCGALPTPSFRHHQVMLSRSEASAAFSQEHDKLLACCFSICLLGEYAACRRTVPMSFYSCAVARPWG